MSVRVKSTPNSPRKSVQLVESYRKDAKIRQRIVRHVGIAMDDDELQRLDLGEYVKTKLEAESQPTLFPAEDLAQLAVEVGKIASTSRRRRPGVYIFMIRRCAHGLIQRAVTERREPP